MQEDKLHKENECEILQEEEQELKAATAAEEVQEDSLNLLETKTKEYEELQSRFLRLQADFENYKRRSRKDLEDMAKYGTERVILGLLAVLDNFARALSAAPQDGEAQKFMQGMSMIYRQCQDVLTAEGLKAIEALDQPFDPEKHDAVMQVEAACAEEDNLVKEELQVGYTLHDKVIRHSMVKVAKYNG